MDRIDRGYSGFPGAHRHEIDRCRIADNMILSPAPIAYGMPDIST
jgi:hypothetical protein